MNRVGEFPEETTEYGTDAHSLSEAEQQPVPDDEGLNEMLRAKAENDALKASKEKLTDEQLQERYETTVRQLEAKYGSQMFKYNTHQGTVAEILLVCHAIQDIAFKDGFEATVRTIDGYRIEDAVEEDASDKDKQPHLNAENEPKNDASRDETKKTSRTEPPVPPRETVVKSPSRSVVTLAAIPVPDLKPVLIFSSEREVQEVHSDETGAVNRAADEKSGGLSEVSSTEHTSDVSENHSQSDSTDGPVRQTTEHASSNDTTDGYIPDTRTQERELSGSDAEPMRNIESIAIDEPTHEERQGVLVDAPPVTHEETEIIRVVESSRDEAPVHVESQTDVLTEEYVVSATMPLESETAPLPFEPVIEMTEVQNSEFVSSEDIVEYDAEFITQENETKVENEALDEPHDLLQEQFIATDAAPVYVEQAGSEEPFAPTKERDIEEAKPLTTLEIEHAIETFQNYAAEDVPVEELLVTIAEHAQHVAEREPDTESIDATDEEKEAVTFELQLMIERTRTVRETADLLLSARTREECETHVSDLVESLAALLRSLGYENPEKMVSQLIASYSVESLRALLYELEASLRRAAASEIAGRRSVLRENKKVRHSRVGKIVLSIIESFTLRQASLETV
jgi:hypothetical protein